MKITKFLTSVVIRISLIALGAFLVGAIRVPVAKAERPYTDTPCEYQFTPGPLKYLPDGRAYVSLQYGVRGNDNARRTFIAFPQRFFTENGWVVNSALGCAPTPLTGLFWNGQEVDLNSGFYKTAIWPNYTAQEVYFGMPAGGNFSSPAERYDLNPGIGIEDAPYNWRGLLGIEKRYDDTFATVNDGGFAKIGTNNYWCLGFNVIGYNCGSVDAGRVYPNTMPPYFKGGDFAGYLNNGNAAARNSVQGALQGRVTNRQPINDLIGFDPNGNQRFHLEVAGMNTRDGNPTWQAMDCLNTFPGTTKPGYGYCFFAPTVSMNQKASIVLTVVLRPKYTATATTNCTAVSGSLSVPPGGGSVKTYLQIDGARQGGDQGTTFNWAIPKQYKDGNNHSIEVFATDSFGTVRVYSATHRCIPNAQCNGDFGPNITAVFPGNIASLNVNDTVQVKVTMNNNGETYWKDYAGTGKYQLQLTPAAQAFWSMSGGDVTVEVPPGGTSYSFLVGLKLIAAPNNAATPLEFRMAYWNGQFGAACSTTLRIQADYAPWLRVQNGNVGALGRILGQLSNTRAGYKAEGAGQDINLNAQYAVVAGLNGNYLCSANAYNYGRGDSIQCGFDQYTVNLQREMQFLSDPASSDSFISSVVDLQNGAKCTLAPGGATGERYRNGGSLSALSPSVDFGTVNTATLSSCPVIFQYGPKDNTSKVIGGIGRGITLLGGRATLIIQGDLTINNNIIIGVPAGFSVNARAGGYDENALNRVPNLGIIVDGNVTIDRKVTQLDAQIYASGTIKTCDAYPATTGVVPPAIARQCSNHLAVRGGLFARKGFKFGRNFFDVTSMLARIPMATTGDPNFDYAGITPPQVQGKYYGTPAEDIIGNGISLVLPPPGFEDIAALAASRVKYLQGEYSPRF